ncbi:hypothetical protein RSPO_c02815 [Ralstonia solanacearum Po82]|uniref:Uncharacterized protein n=1 Tax=Ralstonia solanacearum (strain Po82) TaxID=1031711 RepID=F6G574_RALS8|nr:hypothetical protein RSPO_c02815 [Ralstonia solanacearum Po82]
MVTYSWHPSTKSAKPYRVTESFEELALRCTRTPAVTSKDDGATFSPFTYTSLACGGYSARECNFLAFTVEKVCPFGTRPKNVLACVEGLASFVYSTRSHSWHGSRGGSYQLIVAVRTPIPEEYYKTVAMRFAMRFIQLDGAVNSSFLLADHQIAFPSCTSVRRQRQFEKMAQLGDAYDWLPCFLGSAESTSTVSREMH